jgi:hypothetical protein
MKLPPRKGRPKLPPTPRGGGAAARQRQFELERGMEAPASAVTPDCAKGEEPPKKKQK